MALLLRAKICASLFALAIAGAAVAGPIEDGMSAALKGDYATALGLWRPLAEQGDPTAESYMGRLYLYGWGVPQDLAQAAKWYRMAADQGNTAAETNLGIMYREGQGVARDDVQAAILFRKAAEQGALEAMVNLGVAYEAGEGVPKDRRAAEHWYRRAAASNFEPAKVALERLSKGEPNSQTN